MISSVMIDQGSTFDTVRLMAVEPEYEFGSQDTQAKTKADVPKWLASIAVSYQGPFKRVNEVIEVKIASMKDPGEGITPFNPVTLVGLAMFVAPKTDKDKKPVPGITQSFRCESIHDNASTGPTPRASKSQATAEAGA